MSGLIVDYDRLYNRNITEGRFDIISQSPHLPSCATPLIAVGEDTQNPLSLIGGDYDVSTIFAKEFGIIHFLSLANALVLFALGGRKYQKYILVLGWFGKFRFTNSILSPNFDNLDHVKDTNVTRHKQNILMIAFKWIFRINLYALM